MKRAAESDAVLLEGIARGLKRARLEETQPPAPVLGDLGEQIPLDVIVHELIERHLPQAPAKTIADLVVADPALSRTPDGIQLANYLWFQLCLFVFEREWPDPGQPAYMPPFLAAMQWVNGGVPVTNARQVSPKEPTSGYARAARAGATMEEVAWAKRRRSMWQSIYTACAAAMTLASASFDAWSSRHSYLFGYTYAVDSPVLADDRADEIMRQSRQLPWIFVPMRSDKQPSLAPLGNDILRAGERGRLDWPISADGIKLRSTSRPDMSSLWRNGELAVAMPAAPTAMVQIVAPGGTHTQRGPLVLGQLPLPASPGETTRTLLRAAPDEAPLAEVELRRKAGDAGPPRFVLLLDTDGQGPTFRSLDCDLFITRLDVWHIMRTLEVIDCFHLPFGPLYSTGRRLPEWRDRVGDARADFVRVMHAAFRTADRPPENAHARQQVLFAHRYNWLMNGPTADQVPDTLELDAWFLPAAAVVGLIPFRFQLAPAWLLPPDGEEQTAWARDPEIPYRRTPGMFRARPTE